jgi:hypothetical protein
MVNAVPTKRYLLIAVALCSAVLSPAQEKSQPSTGAFDARINASARELMLRGQQVFRYETFGDEAFWGDTLQLHRAIEGSKLGGVGPGVSPKTALSVGLKVDVDSLSESLVSQLKAGKVDLDNPATTLALLKLKAVVGVTGFFSPSGGVNQHTWGGGWGNVTYWNAYVANLQMHGQGVFYDRRLMNKEQYPVAAKAGYGNLRAAEDKVTPNLAALKFYQLAMPAPAPPEGSFDKAAAARGAAIFKGKAQCAQCHVPPLFTEPGWNTHKPGDIGIDDFQANRSPDRSYRTAPLRGLWSHQKGGFYHDGRFATLRDVIEHYNTFKRLGLAEQQKSDFVEYLKSI